MERQEQTLTPPNILALRDRESLFNTRGPRRGREGIVERITRDWKFADAQTRRDMVVTAILGGGLIAAMIWVNYTNPLPAFYPR